MAILLAIFFSAQYFVSKALDLIHNLPFYICLQYKGLDDQNLPETEKLLINGQFGETAFCLVAGVSFLWFFSLIDCLG